MSYVQLSEVPEIEIFDQSPYCVRSANTKKPIRQAFNALGYPIIRFNGKKYRLDQLIAKQFVPNPNGYSFLHHKHELFNWEPKDLYWSYEPEVSSKYADALPDGAYEIKNYGDYVLEDYWFYNDIVYKKSKDGFKGLKTSKRNTVAMRDINGTKIDFSISIFKRYIMH